KNLSDLATAYHPTFGVPPDSNRKTGWLGRITLLHLATQTAGFEKPGGYTKLTFAPGTQWRYSDGGPNWLAECITLAYRRDLQELLFERVFAPIGIRPSDLTWRPNAYRPKLIGGVMRREFGSGIHANVNAMARIGYLYLRRGRWQGKALLPESFVDSVQRMPEPLRGAPTVDEKTYGKASNHYGLLWWTNADGSLPDVPRDAYWSWGLYDSLTVVVPSLDLVVARAGRSFQGSWDSHYGKLTPFLGAICQSVGKPTPQSRAPYPQSPLIQGIEWDFKNLVRLAPGSDLWPIAWGDDGHLYTSWGDGGGFGGTNSQGRVSLGFGRIEGMPPGIKATNIWGGWKPRHDATFRGKCPGMLCVDGTLYAWINTQNRPWSTQRGPDIRLSWSSDRGASWEVAPWSFSGATGTFSPSTFLNFGQNYAGARDDYVYSYGRVWGDTTHAYLSRVPKTSLRDRSTYQFFAGLGAQGEPAWRSEAGRRQAVFTDPNGCNPGSVVYHAGLRRYLMTNSHGGVGELGVFDAPEPWGPWTTAAYYERWGGFDRGGALFYSLPTKWISADGTTFWCVFSSQGTLDCFNLVKGTLALAAAGPTSKAPYPPSDAIKGIEWAPKDTIIRLAKGGDNWPATWADDDALYAAYGDGHGFAPKVERKLSLGLARVAGSPPDIRGTNLRSPTAEQTGDGASGKKASGMLMMDGVLYMLARNARNAQLAVSDDRGKTWEWLPWRFTTSFGHPTFLNFGRDYAGARDGYVYVYSHDSDSAYKPADHMVLARVPKGALRQLRQYEYFAGLGADGQPRWASDVRQRKPVFAHKGRCYRSGISYNAALKRYLWVQVIPGGDTRFKGGFGIYDAPEPWGPWTTVFFTEGWDVGPGETASFPPKWMSADGRTLHLLFSGDDAFSVRKATLAVRE
ncbi:MAG: DUF4185 domain-containing protein, partial [Candidatus Brocadiae bacterium]|nr:DUF4185 domain-containing protein [Candidatus Brocadiia bacterium]